MPSAFPRKSLKTVCVDTVLFFAMFALVGHITINYWERYTIQNELNTMKDSLYILKNIIGDIGKAYDNLHSELKALIYEVDKKQTDTPECKHKEKIEARCKADLRNNIHRKRHDFEVQTAITKINKMKFGAGFDTNNKQPNVREDKATGPLGTNVSTNTRNPLKSTGTPSGTTTNEKDFYKDLDHCIHVCRAPGATGRKQ